MPQSAYIQYHPKFIEVILWHTRFLKIDDDTASPYSFVPQSVSVNEGDGTVTFTVSRSDGTTAETVFVGTVQNLQNPDLINFVLKAAHHQVIGNSELFDPERSMMAGMESVRTNATTATVEDLTKA